MSDHQQQRYRVIERLAAGGMAEVYIAESAGIEGFKKRVAIKRVLPHLSEKKRFIAMFLDEARLSAQLSHSNVAQVFDIGVGDNTYFIVMEYVDGADLKQVIKHQRDIGQPFPIEAAVYIIVKMCEGLSYAHEAISPDGKELYAVHRDISPPNVLISKFGEVKIVDFGLAKASTQLEKSEAGIIKGKFSYLAPEAAHGHEVDHRADIFAAGIILWEMLAGRRMFQGQSDYDTVKLVQQADFTPISQLNPEADATLDSILARALAREREKRYDSARALGLDLTRYLYQKAKPVSAFDIADIVRQAIASRKKAQPEGDGLSIIDKLISDALLEFTSLREDDAPAVDSGKGSTKKPMSLDFEAFGRWADERQSNVGDRQSETLVKNTLPADIFEEGNLAALEGPEEPLPNLGDSVPPGGANDPPKGGNERPRQAVRSDAPPRPSVQPSAPPPADSGGTAVKAVLLLVIAAGTAAAVWFSGLLGQ
jgi:serine/threonine-protein kinase